MFETLNAHTYTPADMQAATRGHFTLARQRKAVAEDRFTSNLIEPKAGKPREWPLTAIYEAAIMTAVVACGLPIEFGSQAIKRRGVTSLGKKSGFLTDVGRAVKTLPEFQEADLAKPFFWAIFVKEDLGRPGYRYIVSVICHRGEATLMKAMLADEEPRPEIAFILNVTKTIADVDAILSDRLRERRGRSGASSSE